MIYFLQMEQSRLVYEDATNQLGSFLEMVSSKLTQSIPIIDADIKGRPSRRKSREEKMEILSRRKSNPPDSKLQRQPHLDDSSLSRSTSFASSSFDSSQLSENDHLLKRIVNEKIAVVKEKQKHDNESYILRGKEDNTKKIKESECEGIRTLRNSRQDKTKTLPRRKSTNSLSSKLRNNPNLEDPNLSRSTSCASSFLDSGFKPEIEHNSKGNKRVEKSRDVEKHKLGELNASVKHTNSDNKYELNEQNCERSLTSSSISYDEKSVKSKPKSRKALRRITSFMRKNKSQKINLETQLNSNHKHEFSR